MKKIYTFLALAIVACSAWAQDFNSPGDGSTWTLSQIAALDTVDITKSGSAVTMHSNVVINAGDKFVIEDGLNVLMASNVCINIQGTADFTAATNVSFKPIVSEDATPYGLLINATAATPFKNINFEGAGVRFQDQVGATFENCSFNYHNGVSSNMGAIALGMGATYGVKNCSFTECKYSAINGAANVNNPIVIDNCVFTKNVQANSNMPQVNLTVADLVTISNCVFEGDPSLNMVGGIGVSNLTSMAGTFGCIIENNEVRNHRYGITLTAARGGIIRNNTIVDNHYENDPMNGGSGISLTYAKDVTLSGNYIEGNYWGITVIGTKAYTAFMGDVYEAQNINAGRVDVDANDPNYNEGRNIFYKNGFTGSTTYDGDKFDFFNNSDCDVYAQNNYWKTCEENMDDEHVAEVIWDVADKSTLAEVFYKPYLTVSPSGINDVKVDPVYNIKGIYNLQGQKMAEGVELPHGIYIVDGQKVKM